MPTTTPLTDAINALTQYANETTGASDTTLSDAVGTLVAGYGGGGGGSVLPDGYTQLLYLKSTGSQYIDTGIYTKANQTYYILFEKEGGSTNAFGNNVSGCASFLQVGSNGLSRYYQYGSVNYSNFAIANNIEPLAIKMNLSGIWRWDYETGAYASKGTISGSSVTENANIHNILFGRAISYNSSTHTLNVQLSTVLIFRFRVEEDGVTICDMYPAMRNTDKVLGMYDVKRGTFYTNAGTGTFSGATLE